MSGRVRGYVSLAGDPPGARRVPGTYPLPSRYHRRSTARVNCKRCAIERCWAWRPCLCWRPAPVLALDLPPGPVVLSLSGRLRQPKRGAVAVFDMAMLERLPQSSFSTRTPCYPQARRFTGPLLRDRLSAAAPGS
jgi:hypothetical protein